MHPLVVYFLYPLLFLAASTTHAFTEQERVTEYLARNWSWPIRAFQPNTEGWDRLMRRRLRQVEELEDASARFEGYAQTLTAALIQPNFTEFGFGLARAPDELMETLRTAIREGVAAGPREEYYIPVIEGGLRPWFIDRPDLTARVLHELQHYAETWSNLPLTPEVAYGFRLYRNNSRLHMHIDRPKTHVISFILHIDSSDDAEPWPILIEDLQGNTHEVILTSGDLVFYESSKVFHGRPHTFKGSWYSSVFVHFYPTGYQETFDEDGSVYSIPPHWEKQPERHDEVPLQMHQTGFEEPSCPNGWCASQDTIKWAGPAETGFWTAPNGQKFPFEPKLLSCVDGNYRCAQWANTDECTKNPRYMTSVCRKSCSTCGMAILSDEL